MPLLIEILNSAFLFSIARKSANKATLNKNQGEISSFADKAPEIARKRNTAEMQKISTISYFFNFKQYRICIIR